MADGTENQQQSTQEQQQEAASQELAKNMALHLGGEQPAATEQAQGAAAAQAAEAVVVEPEFKFETLKEKFGYQKPEEVLMEIEQLRQLKANPPVAEIKFENDFSRKVFEALKSDKRSDVVAMLAEQSRLESLTGQEVTKANADEIIKAGMQLRYKDLTPEQVDWKFKKQFTAPKEPVQSDTELDEDFLARKEDWKAKVADLEMEKIIEAKLLKPELQSAISKLVLPDIASPDQQAFLQWQQSEQEAQKRDEETRQAYKTFKPTDIVASVDFIDEANNIKFKSEFIPDAESFQKAVECLADPEKLYANYVNSDGSPNRQKYLRDMYIAMNWEKVLAESMKQAKNATLKRELPDNSGGVVRQISQGVELSELDKQMQQAGVIRR